MMRTRNVPAIGARYWATICAASVFGANMGDFFSHVLHLGHHLGLPPLGLAFAAILLAERRARAASPLYYWGAIVTLRTAATNLADLLTHDMRLDYRAIVVVLAVLLAITLFTDRTLFARLAADRGAALLPRVDARYWLAMLIAGTLGTAFGDYMADVAGLGVGPSALLFAVLLAALFALGAAGGFRSKAFYWGAVVVVRSWGTNVGDWVTDSDGLGLGLKLGTAITGALFAAMLMLPASRPADMSAGS